MKGDLRWYQFSIRSVLILTLCFAIVLSWAKHLANEHDRQWCAIDRLRVSCKPLPFTAWRRGSLWRPARVVYLSFKSCEHKSDRDALAAIQELYYLERLDLTDLPIGDDGLRHLSGLTHLRRLNLEGTNITDDGLIALANLSRLEEIVLMRTAVTNEGARRLQELLPKTYICHPATITVPVQRPFTTDEKEQ